MATITLTIDDAHVDRVRAAFHPNQDGTLATTADVREALMRIVRNRVIAYEERDAVANARNAVRADVETDIPS